MSGVVPLDQRRLSASRRGLGRQHQKTREALLPLAYGRPCRYCGFAMLEGQRLQLDHVIPRALGGADGPTVIVHGACNERAGAKLGNRLRPRKPAESRW